MDAWHALFALGAFVAVMKLYTWCQLCYWSSPECKEDWGIQKTTRKRTGIEIEDREDD